MSATLTLDRARPAAMWTPDDIDIAEKVIGFVFGSGVVAVGSTKLWRAVLHWLRPSEEGETEKLDWRKACFEERKVADRYREEANTAVRMQGALEERVHGLEREVEELRRRLHEGAAE